MTAYVPPYSPSLQDWQRQVSGALNPLFGRIDAYRTADDFSAAGDGTTDDTKALTNFWNSAIANPGKPHILLPKTYCVSAPLPQISASNIWIEGQGSHIHDGGSPQLSGTVIRYIGSSALTSSLITIAPVSNAANQRVANIKLRGIGIDGNSGLIGYGLTINSSRDLDIDLMVWQAGTVGVMMGVVASLAEDKNVQWGRFRLNLRQDAVNVPCLYLNGDAVANVSMNRFHVDCVHKNASAVVSANSDNNQWDFLRCFMVGGGTATECISLQGGPNSGQCARNEWFNFLSANKPARVYGIESGYVAPSIQHQFVLDNGNATPTPVLGPSATAFFRQSSTPTPELAWSAYTPTVTAASGTITTLGTVTGYYRQMGREVEGKVNVPITTNGTGASAINVSLPVAAVGSVGQVAIGKETAVSGKALTGMISPGGSTMSVQFYDGTYPGASGASLTVSFRYEI